MSVHVSDEQPIAVDLDELIRLTQMVLREQGYPDDVDLAIVLVTDEVISEYNAGFMDRQGPTDVLAFPLEKLTAEVAPTPSRGGPPLHLGDVLIAPARVGLQAIENGTTFREEMGLMVVHGILHLMGFDHQHNDEAVQMEARERLILATVGMQRR